MPLHDPLPPSDPPADTGAAGLPIVGHFAVEIDPAEDRDLAALAARLRAEEPALSSLAAFGPGVSCGLAPGPKLVIEDHSAIALFEEAGDVAYAYRALLLAGEGDIAIAGARRSPVFERYCREHLGLGAVDIQMPAARERFIPLAVRCRDDPAVVARAAALARRHGGLNVLPYMGTGGVWSLAARVAAAAGAPLRVAAPPPGLTRRVNDKIWFAARVAEVLGVEAVPPSVPCHGPAALADRLRRLADSQATVAVKLPDSASSAGNIVLLAAALAGRPLAAIRDQVLALLRQAGWEGGFPLMVTAWEAPLLASPSIQLWVPRLQEGLPVVEGIFEQLLAGTQRAFVGARPSSLSLPFQERLAEQAARLARLFQHLGYYGRCSFDLILVGARERDAAIHWIECNGRWGGVSIPMTLANRLVGDWAYQPFVICERSDLAGPPCDLAALLETLKADLFAPHRAGGGAVILSPSRIEEGTGFEILVFGPSAEAAAKHAERITAQLMRN